MADLCGINYRIGCVCTLHGTHTNRPMDAQTVIAVSSLEPGLGASEAENRRDIKPFEPRPTIVPP